MLTDYQRQLFSRLMDHNAEFETAVNAKDSRLALVSARNYIDVENELKDEMGPNEYRQYMDRMRQMFAPKEN